MSANGKNLMFIITTCIMDLDWNNRLKKCKNIRNENQFILVKVSNQIDTKKISVQDDNRELKDALVNTEVLFTIQEGYTVDESSVLNERPAYLLKMKSGEIYLALQDYDGSEFYVLYNMN